MLHAGIRNFCIALVCISLAACAATRKPVGTSDKVRLIHLTRPASAIGDPGEGRLHNPQQSGVVITGTADISQAPLARIESADGYAPDSASLIDSQQAPQQATTRSTGQVTVKAGDTVYAIAREHGTTIEDIAAINNLDSKFTIFTGQLLLLPSADSAAPSARPPQPVPARPRVVNIASRSKDGVSWSWPLTRVTVLRGYGQSGGNNKGMDLQGDEGDPVYAASEGTVVYAGSRLKGYGNLIIISHRNDFMTAYAHNRKLLVSADQEVQRGQKIAELGSVESDRPKLFFQVRYKGEPVDPVSYLPQR